MPPLQVFIQAGLSNLIKPIRAGLHLICLVRFLEYPKIFQIATGRENSPLQPPNLSRCLATYPFVFRAHFAETLIPKWNHSDVMSKQPVACYLLIGNYFPTKPANFELTISVGKNLEGERNECIVSLSFCFAFVQKRNNRLVWIFCWNRDHLPYPFIIILYNDMECSRSGHAVVSNPE